LTRLSPNRKTIYVSAKPAEHRLTFAPNVFQVPGDISVDADLIALMMPFAREFQEVHKAITVAAAQCKGTSSWDCVMGMTCLPRVWAMPASYMTFGFDLRHHRVLKYLPNEQGLAKLSADLAAKLARIRR